MKKLNVKLPQGGSKRALHSGMYASALAVVVLAVAAGATLCGVLLQTGAIRALGLTGIMLFELAWALPVWCVTLLTTRINR